MVAWYINTVDLTVMPIKTCWTSIPFNPLIPFYLLMPSYSLIHFYSYHSSCPLNLLCENFDSLPLFASDPFRTRLLLDNYIDQNRVDVKHIHLGLRHRAVVVVLTEENVGLIVNAFHSDWNAAAAAPMAPKLDSDYMAQMPMGSLRMILDPIEYGAAQPHRLQSVSDHQY